MGWWLNPDTAVVTAMIGPVPGALHERFRFQPDQQWQLEQIAAHYERSGRRETYLGDWHSHPDAPSGALSWTDRGVLRRVIATPEARCALPLMMILWGSSGTWQLTAWRAQTVPRVVLWDKLHLDPVQIRAFLNLCTRRCRRLDERHDLTSASVRRWSGNLREDGLPDSVGCSG
ncbi:Mov34/MPN/PAD-1 family protein [Mesorhizobium australicum]|uniref:Mov34/MPN/PAD-1 family protein n=1 Tax=Mesorhizobium australicum TaxID=536018 RepID=UPI00333B1066